MTVLQARQNRYAGDVKLLTNLGGRGHLEGTVEVLEAGRFLIVCFAA
jgi:hypothetical protein